MKRYFPPKFIFWKQAGLIGLLLLFATLGNAQEMPVPVELQLPLFTKILTFDKNLERCAGDSLRITVVYQKLYRYSDNTREAFFSTAGIMGLRKINGIPIVLLSHDLHTAEELQKFISEQKIDIIYIAPLRAVPVDEITGLSRELKVLSISGVTDYMQQGVSVGLDIKGDKPEIIINKNNSGQEGADFSSRLLHLARIIK